MTSLKPGRGELPGLDQCLNRTSAIARVLLCLEGHMANMSSLTLAFPHIEILDMKAVILLDLIVNTNILGC